ncbi:MAG: tRNA (adenosine(37)-N6)-threonylcarbamoyltransferase complex transferase subunit TsaD, partial [Bacteroidota bacterium]
MNAPQPLIVLGIESSCDDTAAAVIKDDTILSNITATQSIHQSYGGVVPELASRAHQKSIIPVVDAALKEAHIDPEDLDAVAYTRGPGLLGSLLVGSSFAKSMAQTLGIPALPIHHMKAHVLAHFINDGKENPPFPFICLTVSGGHTQLLRVDSPQEFKIL